MTKSFFAHFSTIAMAHIFILMGTWQLSQSEYLRQRLSSIGPGVLKLQIASQVVSAAPEKIHKKNFQNKKSSLVTKPQVETPPVKETATTQIGSEFGTSAQGKNDLLSLYKAELRAMIDRNKYYPTMSRRLGQTGTVVVAFTLLEDGHIIDVRIDSPSRYVRLNESALDAVKKVARFKPIPKEIGEARMDIKIPVKFVTI
jgi:periplasmic protein TonB